MEPARRHLQGETSFAHDAEFIRWGCPFELTLEDKLQDLAAIWFVEMLHELPERNINCLRNCEPSRKGANTVAYFKVDDPRTAEP